jgi:hypothetical protein
MTLPTIPNKRELAAVAVGLAVMFAMGRYSVSEPPAVKTVETITTNDQKKEDKNVTQHQTMVDVKHPDGSESITTTTDTTSSDKAQETEKETGSLQQTVTPAVRSKLNVSALVSENLTSIGAPNYGVSVTKEVLGPITAGVFALTNGTIGITVGLDF